MEQNPLNRKPVTYSGGVNWNPWHGCHKYSAGCQNCYVYCMDGRDGKDAGIVKKTNDFYLPIAHARDGSYKVPSGSLIWTCFTSDFLLEDDKAFLGKMPKRTYIGMRYQGGFADHLPVYLDLWHE